LWVGYESDPSKGDRTYLNVTTGRRSRHQKCARRISHQGKSLWASEGRGVACLARVGRKASQDAGRCVGREAVSQRASAGSLQDGQSERIASMRRADRLESLKAGKLGLAGGTGSRPWWVG